MRKIFKKFKGILAVGLITALLSTSAYGSGVSDETDAVQSDNADGGMYSYCVATGEVTYIPPDETDTYSDDEEIRVSPEYNPYADEDNNGEDLIEPYYLDHGRTRVNNPQYNEKCRNTVYIEATYTDSKSGLKICIESTGFMIGPNAVATAGHCVFRRNTPDGNFFVGNATVYPARNSDANSSPFGSAHATHFYCGSGWASYGNHSDDWGIIELDANIGNRTGWLGLQGKSSYNSTSVYENGYPESVNGKENKSPATGDRDQYIRSGTVKSSSDANTLESNNMFASRGDSGGPCYIYSSKTGYTAIGIASYVMAVSYNEGDVKEINGVKFRTIDNSLFDKLMEFRTSTL